MPETIKTISVPGQIRRHVIKNLDPKTKGERDLKAASVAGHKELEAQGRNSLNTIDLHLTNEAMGVALDIARDWLDSDNGNNVMAGKSMLKFELEYEPDDPREIRHEIKMPKSIAGHFAPQYGRPSPYKDESEVIETDMDRMHWVSNGAHGRVRAETLGFILTKMNRLKYHDHSAVQRAAQKFILTYTEAYEQTQRLINGYLGSGEDEDQAPEPETRSSLVLVACGGKKTTAAKAPAGEMYVGNYHQACRMAAEVMDGPTMILSAKYGLITLDEEIENYDVRAGDPEAITDAEVKEQAEALGLLNAKVTILGGQEYVKLARSVWPDAEAPLTGGIGQQLKQLAEIYSGDPLDENEDQDQEPEGPAEWKSGEFRNVMGLPGRYHSHGLVIWFGGKAGKRNPEPGKWVRTQVIYTGEGKYDLIEVETQQKVMTASLASQIHWASFQTPMRTEEPAAVVADPLLNLLAETAPPKGGYEVPANFLELAEEGDTPQARAYWTRRCEEYRRTGK